MSALRKWKYKLPMTKLFDALKTDDAIRTTTSR
jgi:hypothetical protein